MACPASGCDGQDKGRTVVFPCLRQGVPMPLLPIWERLQGYRKTKAPGLLPRANRSGAYTLEDRYFGLTKPLQKNRQTALLGRGAGAPYERFAAGKTSAQAEFISAEHFKSKGGSRLWRLEPKKKDMTFGHVFLFGTGSGGRTHTNRFTGT